jgi:DNA-binding NarL/FixJ family response regulator
MSVHTSETDGAAAQLSENRPLSVVNGRFQAPARQRIVVAGARVTIAEALSVALNAVDDFEVVGIASSHDSLFRLIESRQPDALVVHVPRTDEPEALGTTLWLKSIAAKVRVVLLTERPTVSLLTQFAAAGVAACLPLDSGLRDLIWAVQANSTESMMVGLSSIATEDPTPERAAASPVAVTLTPRELEVLALLAEGCSPPAIAVRLVMSIYTARGHVKNLLRKLGAHSQLEAVVIGTRMGLMPASETPQPLTGP